MAKYKSLNEAMVARDDLAEVEMRYRLLSETFEEKPQLRANLNPALERAKAEIIRLRALKSTKSGDGVASGEGETGKLVAFDTGRFRKSGEAGGRGA